MANKSRSPMKVSPIFEDRIKNLQKEIMRKEAEKISIRDLTEKIAKLPDFKKLEDQILGIGIVDINLKLDRRKK